MNSAERLNSIDNNLINAVADHRINSEEATQIIHLKERIRAKILSAKQEFTEKDQADLFFELENKSSSTLNELKKLESDVTEKQRRVKEITSMFIEQIHNTAKLSENITQSDVDTQIKDFLKQPLSVKEDIIKKIGQEIATMQLFYERVKSLTEGQKSEFFKLNSSEKEKYLEEIKAANENKKILDRIFKDNPQLFSETEIAKLNKQLSMYPAVDQVILIKKVEQQIPERDALEKKVNEYKGVHKKLVAQKFENAQLTITFEYLLNLFENSTLDERGQILERLTDELTRAYHQALFLDDDSKHLCLNSKLYAFKWFVTANIEQRGNAITMLKSQIKFEASLFTKIEKTLEKFPQAVQEKYKKETLNGYFDLMYEEKEIRFNELKQSLEAEQKTQDLNTKYETILKTSLTDKVISAEEYRALLTNFQQLKPQEKALAIEQSKIEKSFDSRLRVKNRFEKELSVDTQKANVDFYELVFSERIERLNTLLAKEKNKTEITKKTTTTTENKEQTERDLSLAQQKIEGFEAELNGDLKKAKRIYENITKTNPLDEQAINRLAIIKQKIAAEDTSKAKDIINGILSNYDIKQRKARTSLLKELALLNKKNTQLNGDSINANQRYSHLKTDEEISIQNALYQNKQMVLDKNGKATKVHKTNVESVNTVSEEQISTIKGVLNESKFVKNDSEKGNNLEFSMGDNKVSAEYVLSLLNTESAHTEHVLLARIKDNLSLNQIDISDDKIKELIKHCESAAN